MIEWILCMLESYQTFFTGLLGFTGVIITMLANAKMQRDQYERKVKHETNSLRAAIKSELNANKKAYELRIEQFGEDSDHNQALVPSKLIDNVYEELLNQIGLLTEEEIEKIIEVYLLMAELPYRLRILVGTDSVGGINNEFIRVNESQQTIVANIHESILPVIIHTISTIEKHLKDA